MQKKMMPNYYGSLQAFKESSPPPSYPEGFTPGPYVGFTPGASVPKAGDSKPSKTKKNSGKEDPGTVNKMRDRLKVAQQQFDDLRNDMRATDYSGLAKLGSEIDKLQRGIMRARKK
jgi:hypothetical protein